MVLVCYFAGKTIFASSLRKYQLLFSLLFPQVLRCYMNTITSAGALLPAPFKLALITHFLNEYDALTSE